MHIDEGWSIDSGKAYSKGEQSPGLDILNFDKGGNTPWLLGWGNYAF